MSGPVDAFFVGGASLLLFAVLWLFHGGERTDTVISTAAALMWVVNWPHFSATSYRLYQGTTGVRSYPLTAFAVPVAVLGLTSMALVSPKILAPAFVHLFMLWSPYHFSGQTVGVSLLYARRAGLPIGTWERRALVTFVYGTFVMQTIRAEGAGQKANFWGVAYDTLGVPEWAVTGVTVLLVLSGIALAVLLTLYARKEKRKIPPIVLLPAVSQYVWFVAGPSRQSFAEFVPFFHSLQYLLIAWAMQMAETARGERLTRSRLFGETLGWWVKNVAGGIALFWATPRLAADAAGVALPFATGVLFAAVQIHHFFVDGVIWKLKNPGVSSPLMTTLGNLLGPRAAEPAE